LAGRSPRIAIAVSVLLLALGGAPGDARGETTVASPLPFDPPALAELRASPRKVYAHWHVWPISLDNLPPDQDAWATDLTQPHSRGGRDRAGGGFARQRPLPRPPLADPDWRQRDMETDVRLAAALGLDGFFYNIVEPPPGPQWRKLPLLLDAAHAVDPGFRIGLMVDTHTNRDRSVEDVASALLPVADHPAVLRLDDGRLVVAAFSAELKPVDWWQQLLALIREKTGRPVFFLALFQGWQRYAQTFQPVADGLSDWGGRDPRHARRFAGAAAEAHALGKLWMAPVAPQLFRPKDLFYKEAGNADTFRESWRAAIEGNADWVQIITWNDHGEGTEIRPSTGIQHVFADLAAYYVAWFKTGRPPPIVRDVLYYLHRVQPTVAAPDPLGQPRRFDLRGETPAADEIELLAFLARPGILEVRVGDDGRADPPHSRAAPAGITSFKVPLAVGARPFRPSFRLVRPGEPPVEVISAFTVRGGGAWQDLLYRAGASSRPPVAAIADPPLPE
jgi:hypothetical protein